MTIPTKVKKPKAVLPAPPHGCDPFYEAKVGGCPPGTFERQTNESGNKNSIALRPELTAGWVIEPEVPRPEGTFLQYQTTRAFMEDGIQSRVQIENFVVSSSAKVYIEVRDKDQGFNPDDDLLVITNDTSRKAKCRIIHRPLKVATDIGSAAWSVTSGNILLEVQKAQNVSFLVTSLSLPEDPSGVETNDLEYYFSVTIRDQSRTLVCTSPVIDAPRWWAKPASNLYFGKTASPHVKPLIDGEEFFGELVRTINGTSSHIYIASWSLWFQTVLTGGAGGTGQTFQQVVRSAANSGKQVYILLDYFNGRWAAPVLSSHLAHPQIHVRVSSHPDTAVGEQFGSYHEKYVCVDNRVALLGGIDLFPDRYQPRSHAWKLNHAPWRAQAVALGFPDDDDRNPFGREFLLWHDVGVSVSGPAAECIAKDFARRWNDAEPKSAGSELLEKKPAAAPTRHNVQVVKTDMERVSDRDPEVRATATVRYKGTLDAYRQAIAEARHYIYIENQYFSYPPLGDMLCKALVENPLLQVLVVIPFETEEAIALGASRRRPKTYWFRGGAFQREALEARITNHRDYLQARIIGGLRGVSGADARVGVYALAGCAGGTPQMIYPHAKTMVVDDTWAYIGSANTNGRGFVTDGEIGLVIHDREVVAGYRRALWKEHLGVDVETRKIREFAGIWKSKALAGKVNPADCTCAELGSVHAVRFATPPAGQKYDGPLSSVLSVDDYS